MKRMGKCLCGKVRVTATTKTAVDACHCGDCRTWGGGPLMTVECEEIQFEGGAHISVYDSSDWAQRAFCSGCGSHLYYRLKAGGPYSVPVGLFAGDDGLEFDRQIFVDDKPAFYAFENDTKMLTGAEAFAQFTSG